MRILLAVHHFPPNFTGGAEWEAYRIASNLINHSHQVQVLSVERVINSKKNTLSWEDDFYKDVPVRRLFLEMSSAYGEFTSWEYDNPLIGQHIEKLITEFKPDVFHLISGYLLTGRCLRVAKELNIPTVLSLEDFWFLCRRITMLRSDGKLSTLPIDPVVCAQCIGEEKATYKFLGEKFPGIMKTYWKSQKSAIGLFKDRKAFSIETLNDVDVIISRSHFLQDFHIRAGVDKNRIVLSRQGLNIENVHPEKKEPTRDKGKLRIGYLGQIAPVKGVHILIKSLQMIDDPHIELKIYGNEAAFPEYSAQLRKISEKDTRIQFSGKYLHDALFQVMQGLDIVVVPSLWYENSPNVILEAFITNTPVIASDMGGMAELVKHKENGLLFKVGDIKDLTVQIQSLLDDPSLLNRLKRGIGPVKSIATEVDELEKIYHSVIEEKAACV